MGKLAHDSAMNWSVAEVLLAGEGGMTCVRAGVVAGVALESERSGTISGDAKCVCAGVVSGGETTDARARRWGRWRVWARREAWGEDKESTDGDVCGGTAECGA